MCSKDSTSAEGHERDLLRLHRGAACKGSSDDRLSLTFYPRGSVHVMYIYTSYPAHCCWGLKVCADCVWGCRWINAFIGPTCVNDTTGSMYHCWIWNAESTNQMTPTNGMSGNTASFLLWYFWSNLGICIHYLIDVIVKYSSPACDQD